MITDREKAALACYQRNHPLPTPINARRSSALVLDPDAVKADLHNWQLRRNGDGEGYLAPRAPLAVRRG